MKRSLSIFIAFAVMFGVFCCAEGYKTTDIQIKMLDIDYNDTFLNALVKLNSAEGFSGGYWELAEDASMGMCIDVEDIFTTDGGWVAMFEDSMSASYLYAQYDSSAQVAGHDLDQMALYFTYDIIDDDTIDRNTDNGKFFAGVYTFYPEDIDRLFNDLSDKLHSLYGDDCGLGNESIYKKFSDKVILQSSNSSTENYVLWDSSANDMWLILKSVDYERNDATNADCVQIMYIWKGADEHTAQLKAIMKNERIAEETAKYNVSDVSGL